MKISLKYGLLLGFILVAWEVLFYNYLWSSGSWIFVFIPVIIICVFIYLGIREIKIKKYDSSITYKNATLSGLLITVYAGIIYAGGVFASYPYGNDHFKEDYLRKSEKAMKNDPDMTQEDISKRLKEFEINLNAENMAKSAFISILIFGTISSLLSASIHRQKINHPPGTLSGH